MAKKRAAKHKPSDIPEIEVTNFGPISKGKFAIKPLTIFVGPSNSGKTYAAMLAHSLLSSYSNNSPTDQYMDYITPYINKKPFKTLISNLHKLSASNTGSDPDPIPLEYSNSTYDFLFKKLFADRFFHTVIDNFNTPFFNLIRSGTESTGITFSHHITVSITAHKSKKPTIKLKTPSTRFTLLNIQNELFLDELDRKDSDAEFKEITHQSTGSSLGILTSVIPPEHLGLRTLLLLMHRIYAASSSQRFSSFYIPASRSGIMHFYNIIVSSIINNQKYGNSAALNGISTSATLNDFLQFLINAKDSSMTPSMPRGQTVMGDLFGGKLVVEKPRTGLPEFIYKFSNTAIPLNRASSAITEIAPLQILQDNPAHCGVIIIEEPEAHLHPRHQLKLAKHLVRMVNNGTRVLLTTHSEFFLEQLSNFLQISLLTPAQRKKLGYGENDCLNVDSVALYSFHKKSSGYEIKEMPLSADDGISQDEFTDVVESMHEEDFLIHNPSKL